MTRYIFISFFVLVGILLFSLATLQKIQPEPPYFLRFDERAFNHQTQLNLEVQSSVEPTPGQLTTLEKDLKAIWAHLNYIYESNYLKPGKDRFTERFYQSLAEAYPGQLSGSVKRQDLSHHVIIKNWSRDGLACQLIDSAAVFQYHLPAGDSIQTEASIAMALYFQGDNWRLDALKIINEKPFNP
ncbi:hypothetical protein [Algoriphagus sediminis]|uniref:DUF2939 domain-containing protein n=1 Tax=Algoriphagus sediminis TaxID=3057113 RepID=A0ABT7YGH7_9BACT|nr:hypothetical protein [Algoriphagus sediminis]MDN3205625.1 hypothetical protein [Algoriphagus sediminis]